MTDTACQTMRLLVDWGEQSARIDELLERGCLCGGQLARLVKHYAGSGFQVWVSCCACASKLRAPIPHAVLKRWEEYPQWRADMSEAPEPEEILERTPVTAGELFEEIQRSPVLAGACSDFAAHGVAVVKQLAEGELAELAREFDVGNYAVVAVDGVARLLKFEEGLVRILTPHRRGKKLDLSDRRALKLTWKSE